MTMSQPGKYQCPKCGSTDSYDGTSLVSAGSVGVAREIGDSGTFVGVSGASTREQTVRKCRNCGEILGRKDYIPTSAEKEETQKSDDIKGCLMLASLIGFSLFLGYLDGSDGREHFNFLLALRGLAIGGVVGLIFAGAIHHS